MSEQYPTNVELHRWAEGQPWGHKVSPNLITPDLVKAWNRAHPDRPYVKAQAYHGTASGYTAHNCRCEPCTVAHSAVNGDAYHSRAFAEGRDSKRRGA